QYFHHYYEQEPLSVVVVGQKEIQDVFASVTDHGSAIIGRIDGDFTRTSLHELGKIVWPVIKEAISGLRDQALRDLEIATDAQKVCGLTAVGRRVRETVSATLLIEEDYHVKGSISQTNGIATVSSNVDVRDEIDDVVDKLIENVLDTGGHVVFVPSGSLSEMDRIVLLLGDPKDRTSA
ncbi:MAG: hypothetical protein JSW50_07450, partial [Candidatus Latescibacterota bacterium]